MESQIAEGEEFYKKRATLRKITVDTVNWAVYYLDEITGEKWVEEYPFAEMQGGGPAQLRKLRYFPWEGSDQ